jgi:rare lipoprotein A
MRWGCGVLACAALVLAGCGLFSRGRPSIEPAPGETQSGVASWYGPGFHGRRTASGEIYDQFALTAAHRTLPHGTRVRVVNLSNAREVAVRINDRGPFVDDRVIDVSYAAARQLEMIGPGTVPVRIEILDPGAALAAAAPPARARGVAAPAPAVSAAAPPPAPGRTRRYGVQVATYADYERARRTQRALGRVAPARVGLIESGGARFYQVRLGPFADPDQAADVARHVGALGYRPLVIGQ